MKIKSITITFFILLILLLNVSAKNINNEKPDFKLLIEKTDSLIKIKSLRGCSFKSLSFTLFQDEIKSIDKNGMVSLLEKAYTDTDDDDFHFTIKNAGNKLVFNGLSGTNWKRVGISLKDSDFKFYLNDEGIKKYVFEPKQIIYKVYKGAMFFRGEYIIVNFEENKSIALSLNNGEATFKHKVGNICIHILQCYDKKKQATKDRFYDIDSLSGDIVLKELATPEWMSLKQKDRKDRYRNITKSLPASIELPEKLTIEINYTGEKKEIKSYECYKAEVINNGTKCTLWFTNEMDFNWSFNNFIYDIPGTVIQIEKEGKIVFELDEIKDFNEDDSYLSKKDIDLIKERW